MPSCPYGRTGSFPGSRRTTQAFFPGMCWKGRDRRRSLRGVFCSVLLVLMGGLTGCEGKGPSTIVVPARIVLSQSSISFTVEQGQSAPAPATVSISNGGEESLTGVSVSISYGTIATGWLTATLSGTSAPCNLTLTISSTNFTPGNHSATVSVSGAGASNSPQTIQVSFTVTAPPQQYPDLVITELTVPPTGILGDSIEVTVLVKNQGEAPAGTHFLRIYFSTDQTITTSDTYTGRGCTFDGDTEVDETRGCSGYVPVPATLSPGTYYVGGIADADNEVEESNENNNTRASGTIQLSEPQATDLPDLALVAITIPGAGTIGDSVNVKLTIQNHGEATAGAFRAGVYFSTDQTLTTSDTYSGAFCSFQGLSVGGTAECEGPVPVPESLTPGTYFVGGIVDDDGSVEESDETNNQLAGQIVLSGANSGPDLVVTSLTAPTTGVIGDSIFIETTLENQGDQDAGAFRIGLYYSTDEEISPDDQLVFIFTTPSSPMAADKFSGAGCTFGDGLGAGESGNCSGFIPVPDDLSPGSYYLGAIVDDLDEVTETNEGNNTKASDPITLSETGAPLPDLTVLEFSAPSTGTIGGQVYIDMKVANLGTVAAGAFRVGIYFSTDQIIFPASDTYSGVYCVWDSGMSAGGSGTCSGNIDVPASLSPGTYYVGAFADDDFTIGESNESNNARASSAIVLSN